MATYSNRQPANIYSRLSRKRGLERKDVTFPFRLAFSKIIHYYFQDICKCSIAYADKMAKKAELTTELEQLSESSVYERKFLVSTAWCFAINNIDYIRTSIEPLANDLGLQSIVDVLAEKKTQEEADRCQQTLQLIILNATDTVRNKILELLQVVADKMSPAMNRYLS